MLKAGCGVCHRAPMPFSRCALPHFLCSLNLCGFGVFMEVPLHRCDEIASLWLLHSISGQKLGTRPKYLLHNIPCPQP